MQQRRAPGSSSSSIARWPGPRHRLVGRDDDPLDPDRALDRRQRDDHLHRRAVRVRDQAVVALDRVGVDLADDQRDVGVHAPEAGVVDDHRAGLDQPRRPLGADRAAGRGEHQVEALDRLVGERPALELAAGERRPLARRALGGERDHLGGRERRARRAPRAWSSRPRRWRRRRRPGSRRSSTSPAGGARRTGPPRATASSPSSNASWSALTASGTRSAAITQEILIGEVEIISMLIPFSPRVAKDLRGDARVAAHPGADDRDLADLGVGLDPADVERLEHLGRRRAGRRARP